MPALSPLWIERRLLQDIENITERIQYDRVTVRLTNLYREIMKFRITEETFFQGQNRKVGDILDFPVGPYRNEVQGPNGLQRIPQFVEVATMVETAPPPLPSPVTPAQPSISKFSMLAQRVAKFHKSALDGADEVNALLDTGEPMVAKALDTTITSINVVKADVQAVLDVFKDLPGGNGSGG